MNTDCCGLGGSDGFQQERELYFAEIAELKKQRNELLGELVACRTENAELRARLGDD